jgi:hypothetical protein
MTTPCRVVIATLGLALTAAATSHNFEIVVYGGTAGGVIAAVAAAREGLETALIEPTAHIGGMVSGGLGYTDIGKKEVIGGYTYEFYYRVGQHYGMSAFGNDVSWLHEPHVAQDVFRQMLAGSGVKLFEQARLLEKGGVKKQGARLTEIRMESGDIFTALVFIDSSYEGDLMAQSAVTWTSAANRVRSMASRSPVFATERRSISSSWTFLPATVRVRFCRRSAPPARRLRVRPTRPSRPTTFAFVSAAP